MSGAVEAYRLLIADVYELAGLSRRIGEREAVGEGTTVARWHVLSVVSETPSAVPEIARRLGQVRQGVQRVVDDLVESGHLTRHPNPDNPRSPKVGVTPAGHALLEKLWDVSERSRRQVTSTADLDEYTLQETRSVLRRLTLSLKELESRQNDGRTTGQL
ncbi:MarR family winged helix-turn-helix transcriptional regulator [Amycolatopsis sp. NPDC057786]|uniref:MarR family winged helix-turn-helix transcriptional regulator n=1 Tax=Amycolatopsis sp. NPDC057786 TaxID=3346250 RepID=UPI0036706D39